MPLECAVRAFGWGEIANFERHLPMDSAVVRKKHQDAYAFGSGLKQSAILADIYDELAALLYSFSKVHNGHPTRPKPYSRPWVNNGSKHIGSKPIPIKDFNEWYYGGD